MERAGEAIEDSATRGSPSTRTGSRATTGRPAPIAAAATSSTPTTLRGRPARGHRLDRRRNDVVGAGGDPGDRRSRRVPGDPPVRRARRRLPVGPAIASVVGLDGRGAQLRPAAPSSPSSRFGRSAGSASSPFLRQMSIHPGGCGSRGTTAASAPAAPRTASSSRRPPTVAPGRADEGDDGTGRVLPAIGIHPDERAGRDRVPRRSPGWDRRRAGRVPARCADGLRGPRRLSAQTMRPEWSPNTVSGRMLADYLSVHYAGERPLAVWVLASEPVGTELRQAVYATR